MAGKRLIKGGRTSGWQVSNQVPFLAQPGRLSLDRLELAGAATSRCQSCASRLQRKVCQSGTQPPFRSIQLLVTPAIPGPHLLGRKGALADQELNQGFSARLLQVAVVRHGTDHLHHGPFHLQGSKEGGCPSPRPPLPRAARLWLKVHRAAARRRAHLDKHKQAWHRIWPLLGFSCWHHVSANVKRAFQRGTTPGPGEAVSNPSQRLARQQSNREGAGEQPDCKEAR